MKTCWDLNGKQLWHADLGKQEHIWGYGSSLLPRPFVVTQTGSRPELVVARSTSEERQFPDKLRLRWGHAMPANFLHGNGKQGPETGRQKERSVSGRS
jgi:hypothetical protein